MIINEKLLQRYRAIEVIMLAYLKRNPETTWEGMADDLGISLSNVKVHLKRLKDDKAILIKKGEKKKVEVLKS